MIKVIEAYRTREHATQTLPETFVVNGFEAQIMHDFSYIWDEGYASQHDDEVRILDTFFRQLEQFVQDSASAATVDEIVAVLLRDARPAVIWRKLLQLAARYPNEVGLKIRSLALAAPLMWAPDTEVPASDFLTAILPLLEIEERQRVEEVIISTSQFILAPTRAMRWIGIALDCSYVSEQSRNGGCEAGIKRTRRSSEILRTSPTRP